MSLDQQKIDSINYILSYGGIIRGAPHFVLEGDHARYVTPMDFDSAKQYRDNKKYYDGIVTETLEHLGIPHRFTTLVPHFGDLATGENSLVTTLSLSDLQLDAVLARAEDFYKKGTSDAFTRKTQEACESFSFMHRAGIKTDKMAELTAKMIRNMRKTLPPEQQAEFMALLGVQLPRERVAAVTSARRAQSITR